jgi:uncharacterized protein (DUF697 family)/predicted GTPase
MREAKLDDEATPMKDEYQLALEGESAPDRANIALFGPTGSGKSTLLNAIFGAELAKTGVGDPVTDKTELFVNDAGTLAIYDGAGLEIGDRSPIRDIRRRISRNRQGDLSDFVHVAWYCLSAGVPRIEEGQKKVIRDIAKMGIPVVLVITKVNVREGQVDPATLQFAESIEAMGLPIVTGKPVLTAAVDDEFNRVQRYGLEKLLEVSYQAVPEAQRVALAAAQRIDLAIKARYARSWIAGAAAFAGGVGAAPIPLADAAVLVPAQAAMMLKIAAVYGIPKDKAVALAGGATTLVAAGGRMAAASLTKLVPGVGSVISASVAGTITVVLGESWRLTCERVFTGRLDLDDVDQVADLARAFIAKVSAGTGGPNDPARDDAARGGGPDAPIVPEPDRD